MIDLPDHVPDLRRLRALGVMILLMLGLIASRLWYLQVVLGSELALQSSTQQIKTIPRVAPRGIIVDRTGRHVLATSRPKFVVSLVPDEAKKNPQVLPLLAQLLNLPEADLRDRLDPLMKGRGAARYDPFPLVRDVNIQMLSRIEERRLDLPGVVVTRDPVRYYSDDQLCTHILGVTRPIDAKKLQKLRDQGYRPGDNIGVFGLESNYESDLRGQDGGTDVVVDAHGRMQRTQGERMPIPGKTLQLGLDLDLQRLAAEALHETGRPGAIVALDPRNGEVLALASNPTYDLNRYGVDFNALDTDRLHPMINRASGSSYPCGSTFKMITAAAGLESGIISTSSGDYCSGAIHMGRQNFKCAEVHGHVGFYRAIGASCNIFFYHTGQRVGNETLAAWARRFGLGQRTGIDLPTDAKGLVPTPEWKHRRRLGPWVPGDTLHMAIGQGSVLVSPLQLADYTAALANGGTLWRPRLVDKIIDPVSGQAQSWQPEARGTLGLSRANLEAIVEGMRRTMQTGGTAAGCAIRGLSIAGKTGTVQTRKGQPNNSMFVGFAPAEAPKIAVAVMVEGGGYGVDTAAPIARRLFVRYLHIQNAGSAMTGGGKD